MVLQLYCLLQSFIINNTVNCSLEFWRGGTTRLFKPVAWVTLRGSSSYPLCFLEEHVLVLWLSILVSSLFSSSSFLMEGMKPPHYRWQGSLFLWVGAFHIREVDRCCHPYLTWGVLTYFTPPLCFVWPCLPWPSSMSGCIHCGVHYLPARMGIDVIPSTLHMCSFWGLQPHHITWGLHPSLVDAPVDIHGRSHNFPFFHPRKSFTGRSLGDCLTIVLLQCPLPFTSYRGSIAWGGAGTPVPCMMAAHTQGNANLWCKEEVSFGGGLMTFCVGLSLSRRGCLSWSDAWPPKSPLPTYPWSSSFP